MFLKIHHIHLLTAAALMLALFSTAALAQSPSQNSPVMLMALDENDNERGRFYVKDIPACGDKISAKNVELIKVDERSEASAKAEEELGSPATLSPDWYYFSHSGSSRDDSRLRREFARKGCNLIVLADQVYPKRGDARRPVRAITWGVN